MAQDVAPTRLLTAPRQVQRVVDMLNRAHLLPPSVRPGRVILTRPLVAYVGAVATVSIVVAALTVRDSGDWLFSWSTLIAGSVATFLMAVYAVRLPQQSTFIWSPSVFVNLGISITLGPIGAASAAVAEALGVASRTRSGWFRTIFNASNDFLANVSAAGVFVGIERWAGQRSGGHLVVSIGALNVPIGWLVLAGLLAGLTQYLVNHSLMIAVIRISNASVSVPALLRSSLGLLPYSVGYGLAAFTFVIMQTFGGGWLGFMALLVPIVLLQGYLLDFARRVQVHEEQRAAHQKEREELLQRAVEASESERRRIARDLHDGVVQNLAGMAFALSAEASSLKSRSGDANGSAEMLELLETSASETRGAMKDLRTLIIELAPPTLRREGLQAALLEVLRDIKKKGTNTELDLPPNLRLREDRGALIFRVAHEVLRNVAAHAHAKNVKVELTTEDGSAILAIQDDGKGFSKEDADRRRAEGHLGTAAIVELAEEAGGTLTIDSEPGRGTLVVLTLPIE